MVAPVACEDVLEAAAEFLVFPPLDRTTIDVRWEVVPVTTGVTNAEAIRVCQRNGEIYVF
jgi:hypothetical protein